MTAEKTAERQSSSVRSKLEEIWARANKDIEETNRDFENSTPPCPQDDTPSRFVGYTGSYTRVRGVFECPQGHQFFSG